MKSKAVIPSSLLFAQSAEPWQPHAYQKKAVKFLLEHACAGLLLDPGLGKTSIVLAAIKFLKQRKLLRGKVLLVAPVRVCVATWPSEIEKWIDFNGLTCTVLHGHKKDKLLQEDTDIHLINPEGLDWLLQPTKTKGRKGTNVAVDLARFKKLGYSELVIDELTKFKNTQSIRFKMMKQVLGTFQRRWGLTGSLAANGLENLFGQIYMLDQGRSLGTYITHFRNEFFTPDRSGFGYVPIKGAEEMIYARLAPLALRMADQDFLDMPKLIPVDIPINLEGDARIIYDAMEEDLISELDQGTLSATNVGVALGKCRQIAGGAIFADPKLDELGLRIKGQKREWVLIHDLKIQALQELVDETQGAPLLVAYEFNHELERLREAFPQAVFVADYKTADFKDLEAAWNRGEIPMLCSHPSSLAHGLNLQKHGHHIVFFALTWDYEVYDQFIRRIYRQGVKSKRVFVYRLIVKDSVEETVAISLASKKKGQNTLYEGIVRHSKKRRSYTKV